MNDTKEEIIYIAMEAFETLEDYETIYDAVQQLVANPDLDVDDVCDILQTCLKSFNIIPEIMEIIRIVLNQTLRTEPDKPPVSPEHETYIKRAAIIWERRIHKTLHTACWENVIPEYCVERAAADQMTFAGKWDELSERKMDSSKYRSIYGVNDFIEVLFNIDGIITITPKHCKFRRLVEPDWEFSHIDMHVKTFSELKFHFADVMTMSPTQNVIVRECRQAIEKKNMTGARDVLKKAIIFPTYRGALWPIALGYYKRKPNKEYVLKLKKEVIGHSHIADELIIKDVDLNVGNNNQFFVFKDKVYQILLCFSRDEEVAKAVKKQAYAPLDRLLEYPPCLIVPYFGISLFAAPFCYLYDSPIELYYAFRAFYLKYIYTLTTLNSNPQGLIGICLLFENLLGEIEPEIWAHIRDCNINPIRLAFKWMFRAYAGFLEPSELLLLWDLIIGYDSLEILPLLGVFILRSRKMKILEANTLTELEQAIADLTQIRLVPFLQEGFKHIYSG